MKVRDGHVSNSSSSSFLLIATKEAYEEAMAKLNDYEKYVAKKMQEKFSKKMGEQELVVVNEFNFDGGGCNEVTSGIEEPKPQFTSKRGCKHDVKESDSFCPKCGKPRLIEEEVNPNASVSEAWYKLRGILEKAKKGVITQHRDF